MEELKIIERDVTTHSTHIMGNSHRGRIGIKLTDGSILSKLITTGIPILNGLVSILSNISTPSIKMSELIDGGDMSTHVIPLTLGHLNHSSKKSSKPMVLPSLSMFRTKKVKRFILR